MAKHPRKKQRLENENAAQPLGSARPEDIEAEKDDEERRLESLLFGTDYQPSGKGKGREAGLIIVSEGEDGAGVNAGNELEQLQDSDLFVMDEIEPGFSNALESQSNEENTDEDVDKDEENTQDINMESENDDKANEASTSTAPLQSILNWNRSAKKPAWTDPDDSTLNVSLTGTKRLRKLRDMPGEDLIGGAQYESRLRREFERINPAPDWATKARKKLHSGDDTRKIRRGSGIENEGGEDDMEMEVEAEENVDDLLNRTDGVLSSTRSSTLEKGIIGISRLRDANQSARAEGEIKALAFHPSPRVPVLMTASSDRRVRLFNVDGHTNPHIQTLHIPELPVTNACFHPSGPSILLTGPRPFFYTFDLQSGALTRSPRGLWGSASSNVGKGKLADLGMERSVFDPSGSILAVAGRRGYVHLVDWRAGGAQVVGSVKMNTGVQALWWNTHAGLDREPELFTLGSDAEVYVWDVGERRCIRRWKDDGGYGSTVLSGSSGGRYLSIGSKSGLVNIYGEDASTSSSSSTPKVLKTLQNLTTSISTLRFNHDSQLLAVASNVKKDALRLVHLPSLTAFSNWPTSSTPLGHVTAVDFSPRCEYIAVGNNRGRALLYQLPHYIQAH